MLRVSPAVGRTLDAEEDPPCGTNQVVVNDGFWRLRMGGDKVFQRPICPEQLELQAVLGDLLLGILRDEFDIQNTAVFRYRR